MAEGLRYYETGKRKTAIARVWLMLGNGKITVNRRPLEAYFPLETHKTLIQEPFRITQTLGQYDALITVRGGVSLVRRQLSGTAYQRACSRPMRLYGPR
jgi:small subunit ribosomal protein S9